MAANFGEVSHLSGSLAELISNISDHLPNVDGDEASRSEQETPGSASKSKRPAQRENTYYESGISQQNPMGK